MNYIEQLNAFFIKKEQDALSSRAQCLYFNLLGLNNRYRWAAWFSVSGLLLQGMTGLSRNQLTQARAELMQKGYLCYETGRGSQTGRYHLEDLAALYRDEFGPQGGTQTKTQTETHPSEHGPPSKNKNKRKRKTKRDKGRARNRAFCGGGKGVCSKIWHEVDPELFTTYYQARGWQAGGQPIRSWQAMISRLGPPVPRSAFGAGSRGPTRRCAMPSAPRPSRRR